MSDARSRELDDAFLAIVADWARGGVGCDEARFDELARTTCAYQVACNPPYARYAATLGIDLARPPATWRDIPAVPASAFKDATLATCSPEAAELTFLTSGTTAAIPGKHYIEHARLYDAALLAGFDRFMLADHAKLRYLNFVPNPRLRAHSSLGYMMGHVSVLRGDGKAQYFLDDGAGSAAEREASIDVEGFSVALKRAIADAQPVCIAGTAFALVALLDAFETEDRALVCTSGSRIMETGGFKGRARVVERSELYTRLETALGIPTASIVAEYGMTELVSQYYDAPESRAAGTSERHLHDVHIKQAPPWLRTLVVDGDGRELPGGETGFLRHVDLGNRSSVVAIETADRGYACGDGIVLLGRPLDAPLRGCSLDSEDLIACKR